jgi:hypothetical protein
MLTSSINNILSSRRNTFVNKEQVATFDFIQLNRHNIIRIPTSFLPIIQSDIPIYISFTHFCHDVMDREETSVYIKDDAAAEGDKGVRNSETQVS